MHLEDFGSFGTRMLVNKEGSCPVSVGRVMGSLSEGQRLALSHPEEQPACPCGFSFLICTSPSEGLPGLSVATYLVMGWSLQQAQIFVEVAWSGRTGIHLAIRCLAKFDHLLDMFVFCL